MVICSGQPGSQCWHAFPRMGYLLVTILPSLFVKLFLISSWAILNLSGKKVFGKWLLHSEKWREGQWRWLEPRIRVKRREWVAVFNVYFVGWGRAFFFVWTWGVGPEWVRYRFGVGSLAGRTMGGLSLNYRTWDIREYRHWLGWGAVWRWFDDGLWRLLFEGERWRKCVCDVYVLIVALIGNLSMSCVLCSVLVRKIWHIEMDKKFRISEILAWFGVWHRDWYYRGVCGRKGTAGRKKKSRKAKQKQDK